MLVALACQLLALFAFVILRRKYGIRVLAEQLSNIWSLMLHSLSVSSIATQVRRIFPLFPLPHGLQKTGVVKLLESLKWVAKPLQPGKSSSAAMSWQVGTAQGPPKKVFTAFDNEVLITELTKEQKPKPPPRFIASQKTQQFLRSEASSSSAAPASNSDPWWQYSGPQSQDPWGNWKGTTGAKPNPTGFCWILLDVGISWLNYKYDIVEIWWKFRKQQHILGGRTWVSFFGCFGMTYSEGSEIKACFWAITGCKEISAASWSSESRLLRRREASLASTLSDTWRGCNHLSTDFQREVVKGFLRTVGFPCSKSALHHKRQWNGTNGTVGLSHSLNL